MKVKKGKVRDPEIGRVWLNLPPHSFRQLRVVVDFWDYTCVDCILALPCQVATVATVNLQ